MLAELNGAARAAWRDYATSLQGSPSRPRLLRLVVEVAAQKRALLEAIGVLDGSAVGGDLGPAAEGLIVDGQVVVGRLSDAELAALRMSLGMMRTVARAGAAGEEIMARAMAELEGLATSDNADQSQTEVEDVSDVSN